MPDDLKSQLKRILERHEGRSMAITSRELSTALQIDERRIRLAIRELITEGLPVASSTESPAGYFLVGNWGEAYQYARSVRNRLIEDAVRRRDFMRSAALYLKPAEQVKLL